MDIPQKMRPNENYIIPQSLPYIQIQQMQKQTTLSCGCEDGKTCFLLCTTKLSVKSNSSRVNKAPSYMLKKNSKRETRQMPTIAIANNSHFTKRLLPLVKGELYASHINEIKAIVGQCEGNGVRKRRMAGGTAL